MASIIVSEISRLDLRELETATSTCTTDVKSLSSYNWIKAPNATGVPRRPKKYSGLIYNAQSAARHPESPLEPLFRALYITHPNTTPLAALKCQGVFWGGGVSLWRLSLCV